MIDTETISEGHPIWGAIDRGGGQTCDIAGVLLELDRAGFCIVPKHLPGVPQALPDIDAMTKAMVVHVWNIGHPGEPVTDAFVASFYPFYRPLLEAALAVSRPAPQEASVW